MSTVAMSDVLSRCMPWVECESYFLGLKTKTIGISETLPISIVSGDVWNPLVWSFDVNLHRFDRFVRNVILIWAPSHCFSFFSCCAISRRGTHVSSTWVMSLTGLLSLMSLRSDRWNRGRVIGGTCPKQFLFGRPLSTPVHPRQTTI